MSFLILNQLQVGREDTEKRLQLLQRLQAMKGEEDKLTLEIQKFRDSDPEALEKMKREIKASVPQSRWDEFYTNKIKDLQSHILCSSR